MKLNTISIKMNHIVICLIIIIGMVIIDQITKVIAFKYLDSHTKYHVINKVIDFELVENDGAMFGILSGKKILFYIVTIIGLGAFAFFLKDGNLDTMPFYTIGLSLMIAGTIGNFVDRIIFGYVRDFITFGFFEFPSFNVADMCMCVGIVMFIIDSIFGGAKNLWK